jgi:hypothetical protein
MNYGNKYWDVCDMVFKYNWMHCDAKTLRRLMKKHLNYHDAGPESVGIIRDFKQAAAQNYDGKAREALVAL